MNLERALTVEGWMYEPELEYLAHAASTRKTIDYARYQYLDHRKEILVCIKCGKVIDPWEEKKK